MAQRRAITEGILYDEDDDYNNFDINNLQDEEFGVNEEEPEEESEGSGQEKEQDSDIDEIDP